MERTMRRSERELSREEATAILAAGEFGVLSTVAPDGTPYGVPVSYALHDGDLYFHCAVEGYKVDNIALQNRVSLCVVGKTEVLPEQFATRYESVIVSGRAVEVHDREKQRGLEALQEKYAPGFRSQGLEYIAKAWQATKVFKIVIEKMTGKARRWQKGRTATSE